MKTCLLCGQDTQTLVCETCEHSAQRVELPVNLFSHSLLFVGMTDRLIPLAIKRTRVQFTDCYNLLYCHLAELKPNELETIKNILQERKT